MALKTTEILIVPPVHLLVTNGGLEAHVLQLLTVWRLVESGSNTQMMLHNSKATMNIIWSWRKTRKTLSQVHYAGLLSMTSVTFQSTAGESWNHR